MSRHEDFDQLRAVIEAVATEFAARLSAQPEALSKGPEVVGRGLTEAILGRIVTELGGSPVYIPSLRALEEAERNRQISEAYVPGQGYRELAKLYGLSERHVKRIVTRARRGG